MATALQKEVPRDDSKVAPYIPRADQAKNSFVGACELFHDYANSHKLEVEPMILGKYNYSHFICFLVHLKSFSDEHDSTMVSKRVKLKMISQMNLESFTIAQNKSVVSRSRLKMLAT